MGKGDKKTRRGKIFSGSYGSKRPKKLKPEYKAEPKAKKEVPKKEEPKVVEKKPVAKKAPAKKTTAKKKAEPKKAETEKE